MGSDDTIFALSSAPGRAGVAVVRISGPIARLMLMALTNDAAPVARRAVVRMLRSPEDGGEIDRGIVIWFAGPNSFTGEDVVELHVHSGRAVIVKLMSVLAAFQGSRMAEAGEFARRAFENGKIGLSEAEGIADIIEAETEAQRRQALRQAQGGLERRYEGWRDLLIETLGLVEAAIDFSDEVDVATDAIRQAEARAEVLLELIEKHLADGRRGEIVREGLRVVLAGAPNVGKSSLLNRLARREAAIVSAEPGTTRDVIEVVLDLCGYRVVVSDTAGLRDADNAVEREGVRRTLAAGRQADLIVWLSDNEALAETLPGEFDGSAAAVIRVRTKIDLMPFRSFDADVALSSATGEGIDDLEAKIVAHAASLAGAPEDVVLTQQRHREALGWAAEGLRGFIAGDERDLELRAEHLRIAATAMGRLLGRVDVEEVLGQIFARFCIGK